MRSFITEFDRSYGCKKIFEEGVEHEWTSTISTMIKTGIWKTMFTGQCVSIKNITFKEIDPKLALK